MSRAKSAAPALISEFNVTGIVDHTIRTLIYGLLLRAKPLNLDVLQLFIVLMAVFPFVLFGMVRRPNVTMAGSIGLYLAARQFDWNLSAFPDGHWYLNPFCWQLLFVLGAWLALSPKTNPRRTEASGIPGPARRGVAVPAPCLGGDGGREISPSRHRPGSHARCLSSTTGKTSPLTGCFTFSRWLFCFPTWCRADWSGFRWQVLQPVIKCGREWLAVFCAGVFLSFAGHLVLITGPDLLAMQVLVSFAGMLIMTGVAYYVSWSKRQDHKPAFRAQAMTGLPEEGRFAK